MSNPILRIFPFPDMFIYKHKFALSDIEKQKKSSYTILR
jgi:hypothetical protein